MTTKYPDEREPELREKLEKGWHYLTHARDGPEKDAFFDRWLEVLSEYTRRYGYITPPVKQGKML